MNGTCRDHFTGTCAADPATVHFSVFGNPAPQYIALVYTSLSIASTHRCYERLYVSLRKYITTSALMQALKC